MAVIYRAGNLAYGTNNERTGLTTTYLVTGTRFFESDTDDMWQWDGDSWNVMSGDSVAQTLSSKTITAPDINGGTADSLTSMSLRDENVAYDLLVKSNDASMGANRTLNLDVNNSTRTVSFGGNITTAGDLNTAGAYAVTLTQTGNSNVTLPTTGTLSAIAGSETLTNKILTSPVLTTPQINDSAADHQYVFAVGNLAADRTVTLPVLTGNDTLVFEAHTQTLTNKTISGGDNTFSAVPTTALTGTAFAVTDGTTSSNIATGGTVTFTATANETTIAQSGGTVTIGLPNDVTIAGSLTVSGTTTTVNSTTVTVDDPVFTLGGDTAPSSDDNKDRGIEFRWHNGSAAKVGFFGFDDSTGKMTFIPDATNSSEIFSGTAGTIVADTEGTHTGAVVATTVSASGTATFNGAVDLGNATSDYITFTGYIDSMLCPEADGTRDIGSNSYQWKDIYINGVGYIDAIATGCAITTPNLITSLNDTNGNELIAVTATSSAVNEITVVNAATGNAPSVSASGGDSNVSLKLSGKGTSGVTLTNATANGAFLEFDTKATPADPSAELARMYLKNVDTNNNAIAVKIQKAGSIQEVEITSPKAVCGVCGSEDGAKDPTYNFARSVMILDLWCGHSFEVPMNWSSVNGS